MTLSHNGIIPYTGMDIFIIILDVGDIGGEVRKHSTKISEIPFRDSLNLSQNEKTSYREFPLV